MIEDLTAAARPWLDMNTRLAAGLSPAGVARYDQRLADVADQLAREGVDVEDPVVAATLLQVGYLVNREILTVGGSAGSLVGFMATVAAKTHGDTP